MNVFNAVMRTSLEGVGVRKSCSCRDDCDGCPEDVPYADQTRGAGVSHQRSSIPRDVWNNTSVVGGVVPSWGSPAPQLWFGPSTPLAHLCASLSAQIVALRARIDAIWAAIRRAVGRDADQVRAAWNAARSGCRPANPRNPCQPLWDAWQASPLDGPGVAVRNGIWHVWNACTINQSLFSGGFGAQRVICNYLIDYARRLEQQVAMNAGVTPPYTYENDIAVLDEQLTDLEAELANCVHGNPYRPPPERDFSECKNKWTRWGCRLCCESKCEPGFSHDFCVEPCVNESCNQVL